MHKFILIGLAVAITALGLGAISSAAQSGGDNAEVSKSSANARASAVRGPRGFRGYRGLRGPRGFNGAQGQQGVQGPPGPVALSQASVADSGQIFYGPSDIVMTAHASCPAGQRAVGGGGANVGDEQIAASAPTNDRSGWFVIGVDLVDNGGEYVQAYAVCAGAGQAVAASRPTTARRQVAALATKIRASYPATK